MSAGDWVLRYLEDALGKDFYEELTKRLRGPASDRRIGRPGHRMSAGRFCRLEAWLCFLEDRDWDDTVEASRMLLCGYEAVDATGSIGAFGHECQMLSQCLGTLRSTNGIQSAIEVYLDPKVTELRLFDLVADAEPWEKGLWDRRRRHRLVPRSVTGEAADRRRAYEGFLRKAVGGCEPEPRRPRPRMTFSLADLASAGDLLDEACGRQGAKRYHGGVTRRQVLLRVDASGACEPTERLAIGPVTHLVGAVGVGKSVLARDILMSASSTGRVLMVCPTVLECLRTASELQGAGVDAQPLLGRDHHAHIDAYAREDVPGDLVPSPVSWWIEQICPRRAAAMRDGVTGAAARRVARDCTSCANALWCPVLAADLALAKAPVVVSTVEAVCACRCWDGSGFETFHGEAIQQFDLVVYDESDLCAARADGVFTSSASYSDFLERSAAEMARGLRDASLVDHQTDQNEMSWYSLLAAARSFFSYAVEVLTTNQVSHAAVLDQQRSWEAMGSGCDCTRLWHGLDGQSVVLSHQLVLDIGDAHRAAEENPGLAPDGEAAALGRAAEDLMALAGNGRQSAELQRLMDVLGPMADADSRATARRYFGMWLEGLCGFPKPTDDVPYDGCGRALIWLACVVLRLDRYLIALGRAALDNQVDVPNSELLSFVTTTTRGVGAEMPVSLIGNIIGYRLVHSQDGLHRDLELVKSRACGRSLVCDLPWLVTDADGNPCGPNVLLMSGTSWAPGSLGGGIARPVDYVLAPPRNKADFLSRMRFAYVGGLRRVSGAGSAARRLAALRQNARGISRHVLAEITGERSDGLTPGKALVVVNSYSQAAAVGNVLATLVGRHGIKVAVLGRDSADETAAATGADMLPRSELSSFASSDASVLVAPRVVIERGHNIVLESGHAAITSLFLMTRPMDPPDGISGYVSKTEGAVYEYLLSNDVPHDMHRPGTVRARARDYWYGKVLRGSHVGLAALSRQDRADVVSSGIVSLVQVVGRLMRVGSPEDAARMQPPHVYLCDAAFHADPAAESDGFDWIAEAIAWLEGPVGAGRPGSVGEYLYGAFHRSLLEMEEMGGDDDGEEADILGPEA